MGTTSYYIMYILTGQWWYTEYVLKLGHCSCLAGVEITCGQRSQLFHHQWKMLEDIRLVNTYLTPAGDVDAEVAKVMLDGGEKW